jgi:hypothetical protein
MQPQKAGQALVRRVQRRRAVLVQLRSMSLVPTRWADWPVLQPMAAQAVPSVEGERETPGAVAVSQDDASIARSRVADMRSRAGVARRVRAHRRDRHSRRLRLGCVQLFRRLLKALLAVEVVVVAA